VLDAAAHPIDKGLPRGAYVLADADDGAPDVVLIGTGSEVHLALDARDRLAGDGIAARVVSMPSMNRFDAQPDAYRRAVLPSDVPALAVEAGITRGWREYVGDDGAVIGLDRFGLSGPGDDVYAKLGFTVDHVADRARTLL